MGALPSRRNAWTLGALAAYAVLHGAWNAAGGAFHVWPDLWQLPPWPPLLEDLWGTLLDLHAQPPFLGLLFGLALHASAATRIPVESILQPVWFLVGAASVAAYARLAERLVARPLVRVLVLALLLANPYLYASLHYLFYTPWEILFLLLGALCAIRFLEAPSSMRLAVALLPPVLLVHTRSLFHPAWLLGEVLLLGVLAWREMPWRRSAAVGATALLVASVWPAKNLARFGFFGFSSWAGMSLARGLPTGEPLLPSGYQARLGAFARPSDQPPAPGSVEAAAALVPSGFQDRPALVAVAKPDGSPNWNHYAVIPLSRQLGAAAIETLRANPVLLLMKAADFYSNGYALYEARWPYTVGYSPEVNAAPAWFRAYETVVFLPFREYDPSRTGITTGFAVLFPLLLLATAWRLWRTRRRWGPADRTVVLLLWSVVWVLALVLLVDGPEGNRVRFSTEPFLFLLVGWVLGGSPSGRRGAAGVDPARAAQDQAQEERLDQQER